MVNEAVTSQHGRIYLDLRRVRLGCQSMRPRSGEPQEVAGPGGRFPFSDDLHTSRKLLPVETADKGMCR
jgi:hypothetical protein